MHVLIYWFEFWICVELWIERNFLDKALYQVHIQLYFHHLQFEFKDTQGRKISILPRFFVFCYYISCHQIAPSCSIMYIFKVGFELKRVLEKFIDLKNFICCIFFILITNQLLWRLILKTVLQQSNYKLLPIWGTDVYAALATLWLFQAQP